MDVLSNHKLPLSSKGGCPLQYHVITYSAELQADFLQEVKFADKKYAADKLAAAYDYVAGLYSDTGVLPVSAEGEVLDCPEFIYFANKEYWEKKAMAVRNCSTWLEFAVQSDGGRRLRKMISCKDRLCPMCNWRRSLKTYANARAILDSPDCQHYKLIFLTLTIRNVDALDLPQAVDDLMGAVKRLTNDRAWRAAFKGWQRTLEITHNVNANTYHPHFHFLLAVMPSYFTSRYYLSHDRLMDMWRRCCRLDYDPMVHVEKCYSMGGAAAEVAKYAAKDADYVIDSNPDLTAEAVQAISAALRGRRLIAYGGVFRKVKAQLRLDDEENGDLINTGLDGMQPADDAAAEIYFWHSGFRAYVRAEKKSGVVDVEKNRHQLSEKTDTSCREKNP